MNTVSGNKKFDADKKINNNKYINSLKQYAAAVIVCADTEEYKSLLEAASKRVGITLYANDNEKAEANRKMLVEAIQLNLLDRRQYSYEVVQRKYNLPVSLREFRRERIEFCKDIAKQTGMIE